VKGEKGSWMCMELLVIPTNIGRNKEGKPAEESD
jgi:hypothetical protein